MPALDPINVGLILVTLITAFGAWATQKNASKANRLSAKEAAEANAYDRARLMDISTIERQKLEIAEFEEEQKELRGRIKQLEQENRSLRGQRAISEK
jgi:TolA-binding protein